MYLIYVDEAGISAKEPVTVVVGLIVDSESQWLPAKSMLADAFNARVPEELRENFLFHAKDVYSNRSHDEIWTRRERMQLMNDVLGIPRALKIPIALGRVLRSSETPLQNKVRPEEYQHIDAFHYCIERANKWVREVSAKSLAAIIAEDVGKKKEYMRRAMKATCDLPLTPEYMRLTDQERRTGQITQTNAGPIDRIIDTAHFVKKDEAPMLQLADACAFAFRRYFSEQQDGESMIKAMLGSPLNWNDYQGPASSVVFKP
ncbi:hypothetical protein K227x_64270 [Rubripirellula lacrimiformis]|uniref:DUF3800 domain-containing protein n=1 Tax=Rubripirellula lacrimiformis TaxID=1930273 RepID=A0A517NLI2_9BACT|nr:DUF3800 domain-containing protein [Rubripirellula lacrimiformis]QDT07997.1 hypothetical protein K227x_64270 [Rubripirellula lacrimiformis]